MKPRDKHPAPDQLGSRISRLRQEKGWTQRDLAEHTGLKLAQISRYERGTRQPSLAGLKALADALGTTADHLAAGKEPARSSDTRLKNLLARVDELPAEQRSNLAQILDALLKVHSYIESLPPSRRSGKQSNT